MRTAVLHAAGHAVRAVVVDPRLTRVPGVDTVPDDELGRTELREILEDADPDQVLVASAAPGGGIVGRWVSDVEQVHWWPTAIGSSRATTGPLEALPSDVASPGLHWATLEYSRLRRSQLPLWDGDYVLAPASLEGRSGELAVRAFGQLCDVNDALDMVVLADPQPRFVDLARELGIGLRVHFAGRAPRDAEIAWLTSATAVLIAGDGPLSAGLLLRALACRCPLIPVVGGALTDEVQPWLAAHGLESGVIAREGDVEVLCQAADGALERDRVLDRGRALAHAATTALAASRLEAAFAAEERARRSA